jgi:subtilisin family serine protease
MSLIALTDRGWRRALAGAVGLAVALAAGGVAAQARSTAAGSSSRTAGSWGQPYPDHWGLERIGLGSAAALRARALVTVAVIDSGIDYTHVDLPRARLWQNRGETLNGVDDDDNGYIDDMIGWNYAEANNNPWDRAGHGTHVTGIIAEVAAAGVGAPNTGYDVRIMPLKVLNLVGRGRSAHVAAAIHYAIAQRAKVINLSLGGEQLSALELAAVRSAHEAGIVTVIAAGNEGRDVSGHPLAGFDSVLFVAASDPDDRRALFSNWGGSISVTAPGVDILSLRARDTDLIRFSGAAAYTEGAANVGERQYRASGTSFAAAFVSGVGARLLAQRPELTGVQVARLITQTARDIEAPGVDPLTGYGLVDANAALAGNPDQWIEARIDDVDLVVQEGETLVRVRGTAAADRFASATLRAAPERFPDDWIDVTKPLAQAVRGGELAEFNPQQLRGSRRWTLQLTTIHENGEQRESRFVADLGGAP